MSGWAYKWEVTLFRFPTDWLVIAKLISWFLEHQKLLQFCEDLEIVISLEKSDLEPKCQAYYLES